MAWFDISECRICCIWLIISLAAVIGVTDVSFWGFIGSCNANVLLHWFSNLQQRVVPERGMPVIVLTVAACFMLPSTFGGMLASIDALSRETTDFTRFAYFKAQLPILWDYIGKVVVPWPLHLEYDYTVDGFATWQIALAALCHAAIVSFAVFYRKKQALVSWGILFYYATHLIESGVIPITDIAFEHRTYLPNAGLFLALGYLWFKLAEKAVNKTEKLLPVAVATTLILLIGFATLTVLRNHQWQEPERFLANDLEQAPNHPRAIHNYAEHKLRQGEVNVALELLERLYSLDIKKIDAIMLNTHLAALIDAKQYKLALQKGSKLLQQPLNEQARAIINSNMGIIFTNLQDYPKANTYFGNAYGRVKLPINSLIAYAYSSCYVVGNYDRATSLCRQILSSDPQHRKSLLLLQMIQSKKEK